MKYLYLIPLVLILVACGGSDSDTTSTPPPVTPAPQNQAPTVSLTESSIVMDGGEIQTIKPAALDSDGTVDSIEWSQTSGETIQTDTVDGALVLTAPVNLQSAQEYGFEVTVTDNDGDTASASLIVQVNSMPDYAVSLLGPIEYDNLTSASLIVLEPGDSQQLGENVSLSFDQASGEVAINNGQGIRAVELTFAQTQSGELTVEACRYLVLQVQGEEGCVARVSANDMSTVLLAEAQAFDANGNLLRLTVN